MSAQQLLHTQQTLRLKNFVKKNSELITYPISVEKNKEEVKVTHETLTTLCTVLRTSSRNTTSSVLPLRRAKRRLKVKRTTKQ
jgi:HSP90 family molecular chaperone